MKIQILIAAFCLCPALFIGCGGDDGGPSSISTATATTTTGAGGAGGAGGADGAGGAGGSGDACHATVQIGLFMTDTCDGDPLLTVNMAIDQPCVGWSHGTKGDSATRFQCYRDRLCYTQYVGNQTCDPAGAKLITDKESRTTCLKDDTPNIYTKILSGTEGCPDPPAGFECPMSDPGKGTTGLAAACSGG